MENSIQSKHWIMISTLGIVWGSTFLFIELALQGITPLWLTSARIVFAAVITSIIWLKRGRVLFITRDTAWLRLGIIGITSTALPFQLISWGQQYVTSSFAGLAMASMPLFVLPLAYFFNTNEVLDRSKFIGLIIGYVADFLNMLGIKLPVSSIRIKKFCASSEFVTCKHELDGFEAPFTLEEGLNNTLVSEFIEPDPKRQIFYTE